MTHNHLLIIPCPRTPQQHTCATAATSPQPHNHLHTTSCAYNLPYTMPHKRLCIIPAQPLQQRRRSCSTAAANTSTTRHARTHARTHARMHARTHVHAHWSRIHTERHDHAHIGTLVTTAQPCQHPQSLTHAHTHTTSTTIHTQICNRVRGVRHRVHLRIRGYVPHPPYSGG